MSRNDEAALQDALIPGAWPSLEQATGADAEDLVRLRIAAMRESLERVGRFDPQRARERFLGSFDPQFTRHVMVHGRKAGFLVVRPGDGYLSLDHLYIHPDHQGDGQGGAVLALVFAEADRQGQALRVGALRESASNRFYLRHGFELIEQAEWDNYYVRRPHNLPGVADAASARALVLQVAARLHAAGIETFRIPPPEPTTCCGRGCQGCVWEGYFAAVDGWREDALALLAENPGARAPG